MKHWSFSFIMRFVLFQSIAFISVCWCTIASPSLTKYRIIMKSDRKWVGNVEGSSYILKIKYSHNNRNRSWKLSWPISFLWHITPGNRWSILNILEIISLGRNVCKLWCRIFSCTLLGIPPRLLTQLKWLECLENCLMSWARKLVSRSVLGLEGLWKECLIEWSIWPQNTVYFVSLFKCKIKKLRLST